MMKKILNNVSHIMSKNISFIIKEVRNSRKRLPSDYLKRIQRR